MRPERRLRRRREGVKSQGSGDRVPSCLGGDIFTEQLGGDIIAEQLHSARRGWTLAATVVNVMLIMSLRWRSVQMKIAMLAAAVCMAAIPALAHHSFAAEFDGKKPVKLEAVSYTHLRA